VSKHFPRRVLFARVGWITYYAGPQVGDEKTHRGASINRKTLAMKYSTSPILMENPTKPCDDSHRTMLKAFRVLAIRMQFDLWSFGTVRSRCIPWTSITAVSIR
jgi:hypothetical protein